MALKKQWFEIVAPKIFDEKVVGETPAVEPKHLLGRKIVFSMLDLARDYTNFYVKVEFQIDHVDGNRAYTKFVGHDVMRERIYRMIQHRIRRVDCVQDVTTKDNVKVRIKTVFTLIRRVNTAIKGATRAKCKEIIERIASETNFEDLAKMMISGKLSALVRKEITKVYPVSGLEIRKSEVLHEKKKVETAAL